MSNRIDTMGLEHYRLIQKSMLTVSTSEYKEIYS